MMEIKEKLVKLNNQKTVIENRVATLQQQLATLNRDYLILIGQIKAYEEMNNGQGKTE